MSYKYYVRFNGRKEFLGYPAFVPDGFGFVQTHDNFRRILRSMDERFPGKITDFYYCNGSQIKIYLRRRPGS